MRKRMLVLFIAFIVALVSFNMNVFAEQSQSVVLYFTEERANEYEITIPAVVDLNDGSPVVISINNDAYLNDNFAVHVDVDSSAFNSPTGCDVRLYAESDDSKYASFMIRRMCDNFELHAASGDFSTADITAAIFRNNSELNFGGELLFVFDDVQSNLAYKGNLYSGSILFNIYGVYE